jgi:uncharacterized protein
MKNKIFLLLIIMVFFRMFTYCQQSQNNNDKIVPEAKIVDKLVPVDIRHVKVSGELGRHIDLTVNGNLLRIDFEKDFIAPFKRGKFTGLNDGSGPFVGIGEVLEGMVRLAAYTGNEKLVACKNHVVESLIKSQDKDGYIGILPPEKRMWTLWDLHEQGFIINSLVCDYRLFGNKNSLTTARKLADYQIKRWPEKPAEWEKSLPGIKEYFAYHGLNFSYLSLYTNTGDKRYFDFAANELGTKNWNMDIVIGRQTPIDGNSAVYLDHCLAQLDLYRLQPDQRLLVPTRRATDFMTRKDGMTITGGVGHFECWTDDQDGKNDLGETCSTAYQMFVFESMMRLDGDSKWGDLIERNLYNAVFAAQSPDGRRIRYYTPFEGKRVYFDFDTYCCPCNYRRLIGFLPQIIYYRYNNGLAISLYSSSEATLNGIGGTKVTIRQETDYPNSGLVNVYVEPQKTATFPLLLRIPEWCCGPSVLVNGKVISTAIKSGAFLKIDRTWQHGDQVTLSMPMPWRFIAGRKTQFGRVAVMRGPLVYTLNPLKNTAVNKIDLKRLVLLPVTAELMMNDTAYRPDGTACRIKADLDKAGTGDFSLTLTEFPDPDGQWIYFQIADPKVTLNDELFVPNLMKTTE